MFIWKQEQSSINMTESTEGDYLQVNTTRDPTFPLTDAESIVYPLILFFLMGRLQI